ncbi:hypothetical protein ACIBFB_06730 [Nocardiopsis sp. NPDC050513]|uniref:hypothetical protein n=1 Tax=Nocardiopsis sp. NPDC050513 TaxID=3364338 RepID=UPI0037BA0660
MSTPAARPPLPAQARPLRVALGTTFVGSTLIAVVAPAYAAPSPSEEPTADTPSVAVAFHHPASEVDLGSDAPSNPVTAVNAGDLAVCLVDLAVENAGFRVSGFEPQRLGPGARVPAGVVDGAPRQSVDVVAVLTYAPTDDQGGCAAPDPRTSAVTGTWSITVIDPRPTDPPSPDPTDPPSPDPTASPSPTPEPTGSPSPTPSPPVRPSPTPTPTGGPGGPGSESPSPAPTRTDEESAGGSDGERRTDAPGNPDPANSPTSRTTSPPQTPRPGVDSPPTSGGDVPTIPDDTADLPDLSPGGQDLAELPLVTPSGDDAAATEIAADHTDLRPSMAPSILLAAVLLALLLVTPLAPARRVRTGSGYRGRRRRS